MTEVQIPTRDDRIYAAGLFDGEGSAILTIRYTKHRRLEGRRYRSIVVVASISNTFLPVLVWVKERWGGTVTSVTRTRAQDRKPGFQWSTNSRNAAEFLSAVQPHVRIKRDQVDNALAFQATKYYRGSKPTSEIEWQSAMAFLLRQRTLNGHPTPVEEKTPEAHGDK